MTDKTDKLLNELKRVKDELRDHRYWMHYKGGVYVINNIVWDTNIEAPAILYKRIDGPDYNSTKEINIAFTRPYSEWNDVIDGTKRFIPVESSTYEVTEWYPV